MDARVMKLWDNAVVFCGAHEKPVRMSLKKGRRSLFYGCPCYPACKNSVSPFLMEVALTYADEEILEEEAAGLVPNIQNEIFHLDKKDALVALHNHEDDDRLYLVFTPVPGVL